jgi:hypothetical protein
MTNWSGINFEWGVPFDIMQQQICRVTQRGIFAREVTLIAIKKAETLV